VTYESTKYKKGETFSPSTSFGWEPGIDRSPKLVLNVLIVLIKFFCCVLGTVTLPNEIFSTDQLEDYESKVSWIATTTKFFV